MAGSKAAPRTSTPTQRRPNPSQKGGKAGTPPVAATATTPHEVEYEFGGPVGAVGTMLFLPLTIVFLYCALGSGNPSSASAVAAICSNPNRTCGVISTPFSTRWDDGNGGRGLRWDLSNIGNVLAHTKDGIFGTDSSNTGAQRAWTIGTVMDSVLQFAKEVFNSILSGACFKRYMAITAFAVVVLWFSFQAFLERSLPGDVAMGVVLRDGSRLPYYMNGHTAFWVSLLLVGHGYYMSFPGLAIFSQPDTLFRTGYAILYNVVWVRFIQNFLVSKLLASILAPAQVATIFGVLANVENSKFMALVKPFNETLPNVVYEPVDMSYVYFNYAELAAAAICFSVILSCYLYAASFLPDRLLAEHGNTGNRVYDFFIGRELNPRIGGFGDRDAADSASANTAVGFDLKCFCELRPGLIGWVAINLGCLCAQLMIRQHQSITPLVTPEMMLINIFQGIYVWDALVNERAILTTMDITTDGFGFMLAFGDLAWVPFTYSLQARYLVENDAALSSWELVAICLLKALGYWIFRGSNGEKDAFRRDPNSPAVAHLRTMETSTGRKLLISGWWGAARKINYTGDWLMGLSWCLLTGGTCIATYFYSIYFAILLIHRAMRDEHACRRKYGPFWDEYKKAVPYVFIPGVI